MTALADRIHALRGSPVPAYGLALLLGLACVVLAARLAWLLLAGPSLPLHASAVPGPGSVAAERVPLASHDLFGAGSGPSDARPAEAPASRSGLVLRGVVAADDPGAGVAFIAEGAGATDRGFRVGDALPGGGRLQAVHPGHVIVERGGRLESLVLPRMGESPGAAAPPRDGVRPRPSAPESDAVSVSGGFLTAVPSFGRPDLASARQAQAADVGRLLGQANIVPVLEGERMIGVRLRVPDPAVLERLGLGEADVVTAVNGIPLDGPERRAELESSLQRGGPVQLTVRRDGIDRQLTIGL